MRSRTGIDARKSSWAAKMVVTDATITSFVSKAINSFVKDCKPEAPKQVKMKAQLGYLSALITGVL